MGPAGSEWGPGVLQAGHEDRLLEQDTHFHCKRLATASMLTHERPLFLVEGENVALQVEHGSVGSPTAFSRTVVHVSLGSVSLHVLLKVVFALECLLAHCTDDFLWRGDTHLANLSITARLVLRLHTNRGRQRKLQPLVSLPLAPNPSSSLMTPNFPDSSLGKEQVSLAW